MSPVSFRLDYVVIWWSKDKFHVVRVYMRFPVQIRKRLGHNPRVTDFVQCKLFNLIKVERVVAEAEGLES